MIPKHLIGNQSQTVLIYPQIAIKPFKKQLHKNLNMKV